MQAEPTSTASSGNLYHGLSSVLGYLAVRLPCPQSSLTKALLLVPWVSWENNVRTSTRLLLACVGAEGGWLSRCASVAGCCSVAHV